MKIIILWSILILIMPWENHSTWSKTVSESSSEYVLGEPGLWTCHPSFLLCEKSQHQDELMLVNCSAFPRHYRLVSQYTLYFASSSNWLGQCQTTVWKKSPNLNLKQYNQFWNIYLWSFLQFLRLYEEKPFSISLAKIACHLEKKYASDAGDKYQLWSSASKVLFYLERSSPGLRNWCYTFHVLHLDEIVSSHAWAATHRYGWAVGSTAVSGIPCNLLLSDPSMRTAPLQNHQVHVIHQLHSFVPIHWNCHDMASYSWICTTEI